MPLNLVIIEAAHLDIQADSVSTLHGTIFREVYTMYYTGMKSRIRSKSSERLKLQTMPERDIDCQKEPYRHFPQFPGPRHRNRGTGHVFDTMRWSIAIDRAATDRTRSRSRGTLVVRSLRALPSSRQAPDNFVKSESDLSA